jgi:hypothetical protein
MKSAYELAMERLNKKDPKASTPLTEVQKKQIAEIDSLYKSKIAEKELFLKPKIQEAKLQGDLTASESLEKQLRTEINDLREKMEAEKEKARNHSK